MSFFSSFKKSSNVILYLFLGLVLLFFVFLFIEMMNVNTGFSWFRSYQKQYDQPYDCKLVFNEIDGLFPDKLIKSLGSKSELLEQYQPFCDRLSNEVYAEEIPVPEDELFESPEEQVNKGDQAFEESATLFSAKYPLAEQIKSLLDEDYYQLADIEKANIIFVGESEVGSDIMKMVLTHAYNGNSIFIASEYFDHLKSFIPINTASVSDSDAVSLKISGTSELYDYKPGSVNFYFSDIGIHENFIKAKNSLGKPVLLKIPFGSGFLYLSSTPVAFTNYNLLKDDNAAFIEKTLSMLPVENVYWSDNYFFFGKQNKDSKLDYIKKQPPLWWAFNIALYTMLAFMLVALKRKERVIPEIPVPKNSTLEFIKTMAQLYLQSGGNKLLSEKKVSFFLDFVRRKYHLDTHTLDDDFVSKLIKSSGKDPNQVSFLIKLIAEFKSKEKVSREELVTLHRTIEKFKSKL